MIWNTRFVRVTVGLLLLAAGVVALLPTFTGYTSLDGTVNAPIGIVSAPIEGTVTNNPPKIGTFLPSGDELVGIRNDRIVRTAEAQIEADLSAAKDRLKALREQVGKLTDLKQELQTRLQEYQEASIRNVTQEIAVREHRISTAAAQQKSADADLVRKERLGTTGVVAGSSVEQARAASVTAENEGNIARTELQRLHQQLDALKRGVFVGEGRNDVPYSQQRMDEVAIQLADVQFRERDLEARIVQLEAQFDQERTRNRALRYALVRMPFDGVIWRTNIVEGSNVIAGAELAQALDCRDLFVDILVSEVAYDEIYPGREAEIRLLGRSESLSGTVVSVRGSAAVVDEAALAAKPPQTRGKDARIRVSISDSERLRELLPGWALGAGSVQESLFPTQALVPGAMVQHYLEALGPSLLVAAFFYIFVLNWPRDRTWTRAITCALVFAVAFRYLTWRLFDTVLPYPNEGAALYWVWFLFVVELTAFLDITLFLMIMSRYADRHAEADRLQESFVAAPNSEWPTVDVFIPTYNEPLDVLERTIVGALALDYPKDKLKIYVLDDKRRDWLRDYCERKGVIHVTRADNLHAKAGNLNNGLKVSRGELVAIFDADFVPYRHFLRRTVPFFRETSIGIVQTPQHFFNKDPVQSNLNLEGILPDEQRLFFDEMAPSRDAWNVSFCCGSCSIARREALETIGGFPTESITEDLLTTLAMLNKGYKTRYLNECLSMGLAAESLKGYFVQRSRWCRGGIQTLFLHNGPIRGPGLTLFQRIMFIPLNWLVQYIVRLAILIVPAVYFWTGVPPLYFTSTLDIVYYQVPVLLAYFFLMLWITPSRYLPVVSSAIGAFSTFRLLPTVVATLIRPFGTPFKVTPKGTGNEQNDFDAYTFTCIAVLIAFTALGIFINVVPEWSTIRHGEFSVVSLYWAAINIVVLLIAALICFEKPRPFLDSFAIGEIAQAHCHGEAIAGQLVALSLEDGTMAFPHDPKLVPGDGLVVSAIGFPRLPAHVDAVEARSNGSVAVKFKHALDGEARDQLIVKLYTGDYSQEIRKIDKRAIASAIWKRAFGRIPARA